MQYIYVKKLQDVLEKFSEQDVQAAADEILGNDAKTIHSKKRNIHDMIQEYSNEIINDALNSSALELAVQKNQ